MNFRFLTTLALLLLAACGAAGKSEAENAVRATMIDGESARFQDVESCRGDRNIWHGEVNGRNRMGAYTGFTPFFYDGVRVSYAGDDEFMTAMDRCFSQLNDTEIAADAMEAEVSLGEEQIDAGDWSIRNDTNPLDDSRTTTITLDAQEGRSRFDGAVTLVGRCQSNTTEVYVVWHDYLGDDSRSVYNEYKNVRVRVGEGEAVTQRWDISTDKQATFSSGAIELLRQMADEQRLVLQTTPYNEAPVTAIFDLTGARQAISQVAETCGWELEEPSET